MRIAARDGAIDPLIFFILWFVSSRTRNLGSIVERKVFFTSQCVVECKWGDAGGNNLIKREPDLGVFSLFSAHGTRAHHHGTNSMALQIMIKIVTLIFSDDTQESIERFTHWVIGHITGTRKYRRSDQGANFDALKTRYIDI